MIDFKDGDIEWNNGTNSLILKDYDEETEREFTLSGEDKAEVAALIERTVLLLNLARGFSMDELIKSGEITLR